jgi:hypothetical protein
MDVELVRASGILMGVVLTSIVIIAVTAPIADEADYRLYNTNTDMFPEATGVLHTFHDWFYYLLVATNVLTIIWYCKLIYAKVVYSKSSQVWG